MPSDARFPSRHVAQADPSPSDLAALAPGTDLEAEPDGRPRYVCACHRVRHRHVLGRSVARVVWSGVLVPGVGLALLVLAAVVVVRAPQGLAITTAVIVTLLTVGCVVGGTAGGHRGWCAARCAAYWFLAFPSLLLGASAAF